MAEKLDYDPEAFRQFEHDAWDEVSGTYHDSFGRLTQQAVEPLLDAVEAREGRRLLEVACGTGALAGAGGARGCQATGLDLVETMVAEARKLHPKAEFRKGDAEALPFEADSFDGIACNFGILHFPHPEKAIAESFRVLAPGGRYALTAWCGPERSPFFALVLGALQAEADMGVVPPGPPMFRFADSSECEKVYAEAGFAEVTCVEVPIVARFTEPAQVMEPLWKGTARVYGMLKRQSEEVQRRIAAAVEEGAKAFEKDGGIEIPMPALMARGRKP